MFISIKNQDIIDTPYTDSICLKNVVNKALKELTLHGESHYKNDLQQASTLRTYILCKRERQTDNYLRVRLNRQQRSMLCQLPLRIKTGHYGPKCLHQKIVFDYYVTQSQRQNFTFYSIAICIINWDKHFMYLWIVSIISLQI